MFSAASRHGIGHVHRHRHGQAILLARGRTEHRRERTGLRRHTGENHFLRVFVKSPFDPGRKRSGILLHDRRVRRLAIKGDPRFGQRDIARRGNPGCVRLEARNVRTQHVHRENAPLAVDKRSLFRCHRHFHLAHAARQREGYLLGGRHAVRPCERRAAQGAGGRRQLNGLFTRRTAHARQFQPHIRTCTRKHGHRLRHRGRRARNGDSARNLPVVVADQKTELRDSRCRIACDRHVKVERLVAIREIILHNHQFQNPFVRLAFLPDKLVSETVGEFKEVPVLGGLLCVERHLRRRTAGRPAAADKTDVVEHCGFKDRCT